eukprot:scaffold407_cov251-Pinguiococcus_pyrenoidosus.AAC.20
MDLWDCTMLFCPGQAPAGKTPGIMGKTLASVESWRPSLQLVGGYRRDSEALLYTTTRRRDPSKSQGAMSPTQSIERTAHKA